MKVKNYFPTTKLLRLMKICAAQAMIALLLCGISMANSGYSQLLDKEVTISLSNVSLETALHEIGRVADVKFAYSLDQMNVKIKVSVEADRTPLRKVLDDLLTPHNIGYKLEERDLTIFLKRNNGKELSLSTNIETDTKPLRHVTGTVTDAEQQPMAGVNIIVKGTTNGTSSDPEGRYEINVPAEDDILVFSFIGFKPFEIVVKTQTVINVVLQEDINSLNEVVINAGYWNVKDRENTGSIAKLTADQIAVQPVNSFLQAMQGRMTGVYISQSSGIPGGSFNIQIRGRNSIAAGNDPLYIVDGIPYPSGTLSSTFTTGTLFGSGGSSPLSTLSPENIESIEVLKDADATAIYGSRGANGVVLITTKKAVEGKSKFVLNVNSGVSSVTQKMDLMDTKQYVSMRKEAFRNDNIPPTANTAPDILLWDTTRYTDWQDELLGGHAGFTNVAASLSGGSKSTQFLFNGAYQNQGTVFPGDARYHRVTSHLSVNHRSADDRLNAAFDISYNAEKNNIQPIDLTSTALTLAPNAPELYDEKGNLNWENSTWFNPLAHLNKSFIAVTTNFIGSVNVGYQITKGLELKTRFSYNELGLNEKSLMPSTFFNPAFKLTSQSASSTFNTNSIKSWICEPQATYQKEVGLLQLNLLAGATLLSNTREQLIQLGRNFPSDALINDLNAAAIVDVLNYTESDYRYSALFGRANVILDRKYIVNLTARRDGSSRFGPEKRFANFWAAGFAWIFSNEKFIEENLSFLSFGKLRTSYGTTGNDQIGDYGYLDTYQSTSAYSGTSGLVPTRLFNPDYAWEVNRKFEAALELGFFRDRVNLKTNYYLNKSSNQLVGYPLPLTTGFSSIQSNLEATVQNSGLELELLTTNISRTNFSWNTQVSITIPRNELISFPNLETSTYANQYVVGEPLTISKRYKYSDVNPQTGIYRFEDLNGDGTITSSDRLQVVNVALQYYGGLSNSLRYKNFQLEFFFQFVKQTGRTYPALMFTNPGARSQQPVRVIDDHWQKEGDIAAIQKFSAFDFDVYDAQERYADSDQTIDDTSFIRLKNVSLSYNIPKTLLKKFECRIYVQGQNLLTLANYYGLDPEIMDTSLPTLRTITMGLQLNL